MSKKEFYTDLVGRSITPIAPGAEHMRDDLPQGIVYKIHTVFMEQDEPVALAAKADVVQGIGSEGIDRFHHAAPKSIKVHALNIGTLYEFYTA